MVIHIFLREASACLLVLLYRALPEPLIAEWAKSNSPTHFLLIISCQGLQEHNNL